MMRLILSATLAAAALAAPAAQAQGDQWTLKSREDALNSRIDEAHNAHRLDDQQTNRAHLVLNRLREAENTMRGHHQGELTAPEQAAVESRLAQIASYIDRPPEGYSSR